MKGILVVLCVVFFSGCATNKLVHKIKSHDLDYDTGVLVGSISKADNLGDYLQYGFWLEKTDHGYSRFIEVDNELSLFNRRLDPDFSTEVDGGRVFALPFPAGEYQLTDFRMRKLMGNRIQTLTPRNDFSIPLTIQPGKYNYLGEMKMVKISVPSGEYRNNYTVWLISDQQSRDLGLLKEGYPKVGVDSAVSIIPDKEDVPTPLVIIPAELDALIEAGLIIDLGKKDVSAAP